MTGLTGQKAHMQLKEKDKVQQLCGHDYRIVQTNS